MENDQVKKDSVAAHLKPLCQAAITYSEKYGFSVIPIKSDKKPYIKWEPFQKRRATRDEIVVWWNRWPNAMIGIVTGSISRVVVIDVDTDEGKEAIQSYIPDSLITPICRTPKGGQHLYFKCPDRPFGNNSRLIAGCDFRGEGGYVIAPPSRNGAGKEYTWLDGLSIEEVKPADLPEPYISFINSYAFGGYKEGATVPIVPVTNRDKTLQNVTLADEGTRDHTIFHLANYLVKGGCPEQEAFQYLEIFAKSCNPQFPLNEMREKVKSAMKRDWARQQNPAQWVREWVSVASGYFSVTELYNSLQNVTSDIKANIRQILHRLCKENPPILERHPNKNGAYRKVETECEEIDFLHANDEVVNIRWPFGIEKYVEVCPKNIVMVAGEKDSGKTAFLLNTVRMNMYAHRIFFFSSEMGDRELRKRLLKFGSPLEEWSFVPLERSSNFGDVVRPDDINIIDFLEVYDEFYKIGLHIKEVYDKLKMGIAIIAIQKNPNVDWGLGGMRSMEKAFLYVAMERGRIKIVSGKNWASEVRPDGLVLDFKLVQGCEFKIQKDWYRG